MGISVVCFVALCPAYVAVRPLLSLKTHSDHILIYCESLPSCLLAKILVFLAKIKKAILFSST